MITAIIIAIIFAFGALVCYASCAAAARADKISELLDIQIPVEDKTEQTLKGVNVVITGRLVSFKNRDELKSAIESRGGKVVGSVSGNTNYLINNDNTSTSAKNIKAQSLGVPFLTEEEFITKFLT